MVKGVVSDAVSLSWVDVVFNVLYPSGVDIYIDVLFSIITSVFDLFFPNFHFYQLIPVAFVVVHVLYDCIIMNV